MDGHLLQSSIMVRKSKPEPGAVSSSVRKGNPEPTLPSAKTPGKFTKESLEALGFEVPEPRGDGFVIGSGGPTRS
jgi:hypothetical protein